MQSLKSVPSHDKWRTIKAAPVCMPLLPKYWDYMASTEPIQKPGKQFSDLFQRSYFCLIATRVGLDRHRLAHSLTVFQEKCHVSNAERNTFAFFLESRLFLCTLGNIYPMPLLPYLRNKIDICLSVKTTRLQLKNNTNQQTHWTFIRTNTILNLMSPISRLKLALLQKPIWLRAGLRNLQFRNIVASQSKIMMKFRGPPVHGRPRELRRKEGPEGLRYLRLRTPHANKYTRIMPLPFTILVNRPLYLEWTPGPIKWPTDDTREFFDKCHHRRELELAARLGLTCQQYLDSKKRIFFARVAKAKRGLPLRKIDAQRACRIHYKKAGSLYTAFKSAGLLRLDKLILYPEEREL